MRLQDVMENRKSKRDLEMMRRKDASDAQRAKMQAQQQRQAAKKTAAKKPPPKKGK